MSENSTNPKVNNELKGLSKILHNDNCIGVIEYLIENGNVTISLTELSEKLEITPQNLNYILKIMENFVERTLAENYRSEHGLIVIPQIKEEFKTFFQNLKIDWKKVNGEVIHVK